MSAWGPRRAAQLKLDLFNKETKVEENKEAIRLLREADIFTEAQFIVGLDNETPETLEETYRWPGTGSRTCELVDVYALAVHAAVPGNPGSGGGVRLFEIQLRDADHEACGDDAGGFAGGVLKNYRRFYMKKALFHYPWRGTGFRRRYLLAALRHS